MPPVLERDALSKSPLADLHVIANELGLDGFRRLRKADLIDAILARRPGTPAPAPAETADADADAGEAPKPRRRRAKAAPKLAVVAAAEPDEPEEAGTRDGDDEPGASERPRRGRRGGRGRGRGRADADLDGGETTEAPAAGGDRSVEGVVELLGNGSAFLRLTPPEPTDDDVYVSAAQVKRCELVSGDKVAGPLRPPRRSERFPSLVRVDTINGRPADEVAEGTKFDDLPVNWPVERLALGSEDVTLKAVEWLTPFGKGSRVVIAGPARAGKSELVAQLAQVLAAQDGLELLVALAGVRPEEVAGAGAPAPVAALTFAATADAQAQAVEQVVEQGRRVAARGGDAVVVVDTLDGLPPQAARRTLAAARNIADGGSLTVIATASEPLGGETTVVVLDAQLTALRRFPALDLTASGTLRPELLVGDAGAEAIAQARADAAAAEPVS